MTDQHPLTDEVIGKTFNFSGEYTSRWYDENDMRAAADWQLEQVIKWLKHNTSKYVYNDSLGFGFDQYECLEDLQKAMRPTTTQENNK